MLDVPSFIQEFMEALYDLHGTETDLERKTEERLRGLSAMPIPASEIFIGIPQNERSLVKEDIKNYFYQHLAFSQLYDDGLYYISQPFNSVGHPDILLIICGIFVLIECKGSKKPDGHSFNNTLPPEKTIYLFSVPGEGSCLVMGDDLVSSKQRELCEQQAWEQREMNERHHREAKELGMGIFGFVKHYGRTTYHLFGGSPNDIIKKAREIDSERNIIRFLFRHLKNVNGSEEQHKYAQLTKEASSAILASTSADGQWMLNPST